MSETRHVASSVMPDKNKSYTLRLAHFDPRVIKKRRKMLDIFLKPQNKPVLSNIIAVIYRVFSLYSSNFMNT